MLVRIENLRADNNEIDATLVSRPFKRSIVVANHEPGKGVHDGFPQFSGERTQ